MHASACASELSDRLQGLYYAKQISETTLVYVAGQAQWKTLASTPELMRKFGEFVHGLSGRYITAEDVGIETRDMDIVRDVTPYVTGISEERGGAGNPSPVTAYGV